MRTSLTYNLIVQGAVRISEAFLAQMVERWPFKPMAVGSIPTEGVYATIA